MNKSLKKAMKEAAQPHARRGKRAAVNNFSFPSTSYNTGISLEKPQVISSPTDGQIISDPIPIPQGTTMQDLYEERTDITPIPDLPPPSGPSIGDEAALLAANQAAIDAQKAIWQQRYNYLMSTPLETLKGQGYGVLDPRGYTDGSIHLNGEIWLALQDIQEIENANGTGGALLMHFQEPELAKDSAGYGAGNTGTFTGTEPPHEVIPEVQVLPPVEKDESGNTVFTEQPAGNLPAVGDATGLSTQNVMPLNAKYWYLYIIAAIVIVIIYVKFVKR